VLRLLSERRDDLAEERTRTANRLHALLRDLVEGGAKHNLTVDRTVALLREVRPTTRPMNSARPSPVTWWPTNHSSTVKECVLSA